MPAETATRTRLFISHASEDKEDFVRPLAVALRGRFVVWYDEYELTMGDSLRQKIDAGLRACDFGVVVLSRAFFSKKWPQVELDGLMALETANRKIILPIWKDVSEEEVKDFSPLLAGRLGVRAENGIERIVSEIERAIQASQRTREIASGSALLESVLALDVSIQEQANAFRLSHSEEGVRLVEQSFHNLADLFKARANSLNQTSKALKFTVTFSTERGFIEVAGHHGILMRARLDGLGGNFTDETQLRVIIYRRKFEIFHQEVEPTILRELNFSPSFDLTNHVLWGDPTRKQKLSDDRLPEQLLLNFVDEIRHWSANQAIT